MHVILATHNRHKIKEISDVIYKSPHPPFAKGGQKEIKIESLLDYPDVVLPPETGTTFVENARVKARTVFDKGVKSCVSQNETKDTPFCESQDLTPWILADDSGLCVDMLGGRPGVYSSRYSGEPTDYARNNRKLLGELKGVPWEKRTAHFICSMVLIDPSGKEHEIEGRVNGYIAEEESSGTEGFGYDPVFYLPEYKATIAELPFEEKNKLSHRGLAAQKALQILLKSIS